MLDNKGRKRMPVNQEKVLEVLRSINDPGLKRDIVSLDFVRDLKIEGSTVKLRLVINTPISPSKSKLKEIIRDKLRTIPGVDEVETKMESVIPKPGPAD